MQIKTILNAVEKYKSFIYGKVHFKKVEKIRSIVVELLARKNSCGICNVCGKHCPSYDKQKSRLYAYVPLWNIPVYFKYAARRVCCPQHGVVTESIPWAEGKEQITKSYKLFLAHWAKRMSWKEVATTFKTSWQTVYRSVKSMVEYGLENRDLSGIEKIGVDEIAVHKGHEYLTQVYQIDEGEKRLLWCGEERKAKTLLRFFRWLGKERTKKLKFVCSDMWKPYLKVIKKKAGHAVHILDRFHIMKKINGAVDETRRQEYKQLLETKEEEILKHARWPLLKRKENLTEKQTVKLDELLKSNLQSVKAYLMKEDFQRFWEYDSSDLAGQFLDEWIIRTNRSNIEPMKKAAKMLKRHKPLILNWFASGKSLSSGVVEGLNNKAKVTMRKSYGFRTNECLKIALYHSLGSLPAPESTHRFW